MNFATFLNISLCKNLESAKKAAPKRATLSDFPPTSLPFFTRSPKPLVTPERPFEIRLNKDLVSLPSSSLLDGASFFFENKLPISLAIFLNKDSDLSGLSGSSGSGGTGCIDCGDSDVAILLNTFFIVSSCCCIIFFRST